VSRDRCHRGIQLIESIIKRNNRFDLVEIVVPAYRIKAQIHARYGEYTAALQYLNKSLCFMDSLIQDHGRKELLGDEALIQLDLVRALMLSGSPVSDQSRLRKVISVLSEESDRTGRRDLKHGLSQAMSLLEDWGSGP